MLLVRSAGRDDPDLVLCSLNLDDDGSLRLLSQFRAHEATRHLPILMVGEEDQTDKLAKALDLGANDYLMKPVDRNELLARVRTQIRRRRYQERLRENYEQSLSLALTDSLARKGVVEGKGVSGRVVTGGRRIIKKKIKTKQ